LACLSTTHGGRSVALEQFLTMKTVETHLAADAIAFLDHRQNVRCILAERFCYEVDIAGKLVMADERRPKRATKVKPSWKMTGMSRLFAWFYNLAENSDHFVLRRKRCRARIHPWNDRLAPSGFAIQRSNQLEDCCRAIARITRKRSILNSSFPRRSL
jgi:hypothetical protein